MALRHLCEAGGGAVDQGNARLAAEAAGIGRLPQRDHHGVFRYAQIFNRTRECETVRRDYAGLTGLLDQAPGVEVLGVDDGVEGVDEDAPLGCSTKVVTEARQAVTYDAVTYQAVLEGRDHPLEGAFPYPLVGPDAHGGV